MEEVLVTEEVVIDPELHTDQHIVPQQQHILDLHIDHGGDPHGERIIHTVRLAGITHGAGIQHFTIIQE